MRNFSGQISFRNKLLIYATITSSLALVLACTAFIVYDGITFRKSIIEKLKEGSNVIAAGSTAAVTFNDPDSASENLSALKAAPLIIDACIFDNSDELLARLDPDKADPPPTNSSKQAGHKIEGQSLYLFTPILIDRERIGTLYIQRSLTDESKRLNSLLSISALVLFLAMGAAFLSSLAFNRIISRPVLELVRVSKHVSEQQAYDMRAKKFSNDEIGTLTDSFNEMLTQIQEQTSAIQEARVQLEKRVQERTKDFRIAKEEAEASAISLKESEERIRAIMDTAADAIITINEDGLISSFNRSGERIFGYAAKEIIGQSASELIPSAKFGAHQSQINKYFTTEDGSTGNVERETEGLRKNEERFPIALRVSEMHYHEERILIWILQDISERKENEREIAEMNKTVVDMARQAGMAEVATGVLHNVGNVLNSVNVSANLAEEKIRHSRVDGLVKAMALFKQHENDLSEFLSNSKQGKALIPYLNSLAEYLMREKEDLSEELKSLLSNVEHIKEIVSMQQSYAGLAGVTEKVLPVDLMEDAIRLNAGALNRHDIEVTCKFDDTPHINVDKHKMLQILINLIRNSKYALADTPIGEKKITLGLSRKNSGEQFIQFEVKDNGTGIQKEHLTRIFAHGFTTRSDGHGFGLHASSLAAKEMGGELTVASDGPNTGATFTLTVPFQKLDEATST